MPIYAYRCNACGFEKDHLQKPSDPVLNICPECNQESYQKQVTAAGFPAKGQRLVGRDRLQRGKPVYPHPNPKAPRRAKGCAGAEARKQLIKRYFITGLLIWVPLAITALH